MQILYQWIPVIAVIIAAIVGYIFSTVKIYREQKQKMYKEVLPVILHFIHKPTTITEKEFNEALATFWVYANKRACKAIDDVISCRLHIERYKTNEDFNVDLIRKNQCMIKAVRYDLLGIFSWISRFNHTIIRHYYIAF